MATGKPQWKQLLLPFTAFALLLPLLLGLSAWQWQRGASKAERWEQFASLEQASPVEVDRLPEDRLAGRPEFQRVAVRGQYLGDYTLLLDNRPENGRPGWHVLTPFRLAGSDALLLVDRGWLPKQHGSLPQFATPAGELQLSGRLATLPRPGLELEATGEAGGWPRIMQFPTADEVAAALHAAGIRGRVASRILWLDPQLEHGFQRDWQPAGLPPERHFAYAFQWLALALTLVVIFIFMLRRWWKSGAGTNTDTTEIDR